jgi:hypothetical protein
MSLNEIGLRFGFVYSPRLVFIHEKELRNYYSWGFDREACSFTAAELDIENLLDRGGLTDGLCVGHVGEVDGVDVGYGLFTEIDIRKGTVIGEYVGIVSSLSGSSSAYAFNYPSTDGGYTVEAVEYGNLMRFMNHSDNPNCAYHTVYHEGIAHLVAVSQIVT